MKLTTAPKKAPMAVAATYQTRPISTKKIRVLKSATVAVKEAIWDLLNETISEGGKRRRITGAA
jgi:hypothetical protein